MGKLLIDNYLPENYGANAQNWCAIEDNRGVIYFGNTENILEYDGTNWRKILIPNSTALSMDIDKNGRIYVGGINEFGYLAPDSLGLINYFSISKDLKSKNKDFKNVWTTIYHNEAIYFRTSEFICRYNSKNTTNKKTIFKIWKKKNINSFFIVNNEKFVGVKGVGLCKIIGDSIKLIKQSNIFANTKIYGIFVLEKKTIIATKDKGLYIYNKNSKSKDSIIYKINLKADKFLIQNHVYKVIVLNNNYIAFTTRKNGVLITDYKFNPIQILNKDVGVAHNFVFNVFQSKLNDLWICSNQGIDKVKLETKFTLWDESLGVDNTVDDIIKFNKKIYYTSLGGLYFLNNSSFYKNTLSNNFLKTTELNKECYKFLVFKENSPQKQLLVATNSGIYKKTTKKKFTKVGNRHSLSFCISKKSPNLVFVGERGGLSSMWWNSTNNKWVDNGQFSGLSLGDVQNLVEDDYGNLWLCDNLKIFKLKFQHNKNPYSNIISNNPVNIKTFDSIQNVVGLSQVKIFNYKNKDTSLVIFTTSKGFYNYDKEKDKIVKCDFFINNFNETITSFTQDKKGNVYFNQAFCYLQKNGSFKVDSFFMKRLNWYANSLYYNNEVLWIGSIKKLGKIDISKQNNDTNTFNTIIRKVTITDSVIFKGTNFSEYNNTKNLKTELLQTENLIPILKYKNNSILFEFSALFFEKENSNLYSYFLEGFDKKWSVWSNKTEKEYTNLHEGNYCFNVKAKNIFGVESVAAKYKFVILPPWYRTFLAFIIYFILSALFIFLIVKLNTKRLIQAKNKLEKTVSLRTKEITEKNIILKMQNEEINAQNEEIKAVNTQLDSYKDHLEEKIIKQTKDLIKAKENAEKANQLKTAFLENLSHEIRTPLNAICGFSEILGADNTLSEENVLFIKHINKSSETLLNIITSIISVSKIQVGDFDIKITKQNLFRFLQKIYNELKTSEKLKENKNIELKLNTNNLLTDKIIYSDFYTLKIIFSSLIDNAIKFTEKGTVEFGVLEEDENTIQFYVNDTGIGISKNESKFIFDKFRKIDSDKSKLYRGLGLGLNIAKSMIEKLGGKIRLNSEINKGTSFYFTIPINKKT